MLDQHALDDVGQRQVRQHAVFGGHGDALDAGLERPGKTAKALHHALGLAGRARGVNQRRQFFSTAMHLALHRKLVGANGVPAFAVVDDIGRRQRVADAGQVGGEAGFHVFPGIELADKTGFGFAVRQDVGDGVGCQRGVERHRDMPGHPDCQIAHEPPGAVFGQDGDIRAWRPPLRLQVSGHAARLVGDLAPGEVMNHTAAHRLRQGDLVGRCFFPVVQALQRQHVRRKRGHVMSLLALS